MKAIYIMIVFALASCGAQPFKHSINTSTLEPELQAYAQEWIGGAPGSGAGVNLYFPTQVLKGYKFQSVYYGGMHSNVANYTAADKRMMIVRLANGKNVKPDLIMDKKSVNESVNKAPDVQKFPYELKDNEAVIIAIDNKHPNKEVLIQLTHIASRARLDMPSMPR